MASYTLGTPVTVSVSFTVDSVATDPTTVILRYRRRGKPETTDTYGGGGSIITKTAVGSYQARIDPGEEGEWEYRWEGTAPAKGASEGTFTVTSSYL